MKYIEKQIMALPFHVPLNAHKVVSYTVNVDQEIITANIFSFYDSVAIGQEGVQPLAQYSVVIAGKPDDNTLYWIYQQLASGGTPVKNEYNYQGSFQVVDRNSFKGGKIKPVPKEPATPETSE